jgi:hypothetical protein
LTMGQRIENGNAAIHRELAQQGATIAEVLRLLHVNPSPVRIACPSPRGVSLVSLR